LSLLVVGSIALDSVETPHGEASETLGGSAVYFAYAASFFGPVRLVGVVGEDFPQEHLDLLARRPIDLAGLQRVPGRTFRWHGRYVGDMSAAETVDVQLNVFGEFEPDIPEAFRQSEFVFLANGSPSLQRHVLEQMERPRFAVADTMNLWIETARDDLLELLKKVDGLVLNDGEARQLTRVSNLITAGREILGLGPRAVVIKKGEHGALLLTDEHVAAMPAHPTAVVRDPTGAGDSFAGGMMGYLARAGDVSAASLKRAIARGVVVASFCVEAFSLGRFQGLEWDDIVQRVAQYRDMLRI